MSATTIPAFRPFDAQDWEVYDGCRSECPLIVSVGSTAWANATPGYDIVIDGPNVVVFIKENGGGFLYLRYRGRTKMEALTVGNAVLKMVDPALPLPSVENIAEFFKMGFCEE